MFTIRTKGVVIKPSNFRKVHTMLQILFQIIFKNIPFKNSIYMDRTLYKFF